MNTHIFTLVTIIGLTSSLSAQTTGGGTRAFGGTPASPGTQTVPGTSQQPQMPPPGTTGQFQPGLQPDALATPSNFNQGPLMFTNQFGIVTTNFLPGSTVPNTVGNFGRTNLLANQPTNQFGPGSVPPSPTGPNNTNRIFPLPPGLQNRGTLPPGLQNRDELPPGLQPLTNAPPRTP